MILQGRKSQPWRCNSACHLSRPRNNAPPDIVSLRLTTTPLRKSCRRRPCTGSRTRPQKTRRYQLYIVACHWLRPHKNAPPDRLCLPLTMTPLRNSCRRRPCTGSRKRPQKKNSCRCCKADMRRYLGSSCRWRCMYQQHTKPDWDTAWRSISTVVLNEVGSYC